MLTVACLWRDVCDKFSNENLFVLILLTVSRKIAPINGCKIVNCLRYAASCLKCIFLVESLKLLRGNGKWLCVLKCFNGMVDKHRQKFNLLMQFKRKDNIREFKCHVCTISTSDISCPTDWELNNNTSAKQ